MSTIGQQNIVPDSFQNFMVPISTQQSSSTAQYDSVASHYAQLGVGPRQSVIVVSSSEPLF